MYSDACQATCKVTAWHSTPPTRSRRPWLDCAVGAPPALSPRRAPPPTHGAHGGHGGPWGRARRRGPMPARGRFAGPARVRMLDALIAASGPLSVSEIAEAIGVDQPRASRLVQQAEQMGLVAREPDPDDARRTRVRLTPEGEGSSPASAVGGGMPCAPPSRDSPTPSAPSSLACWRSSPTPGRATDRRRRRCRVARSLVHNSGDSFRVGLHTRGIPRLRLVPPSDFPELCASDVREGPWPTARDLAASVHRAAWSLVHNSGDSDCAGATSA